jgi:hypothetical protein
MYILYQAAAAAAAAAAGESERSYSSIINIGSASSTIPDRTGALIEPQWGLNMQGPQ